MFQVIFATNPQEIVEYFSMQASSLTFVSLLSVVVFYIFSRFLLPMIIKFISNYHNFLIVSLLTLFVLCSAVLYEIVHDDTKKLSTYFNCISINRIAHIVPKAYEEITEAQAVYNNFDAKQVKITKNNSTIPYVVFILGESTSKHHMQLYGYNIPNTPKLLQRKQAGELQIFQDVISPHASTMAVIKTLFTFYNNDAPGDWYDYLNLFDVLKAAGYHTSWLSNQESAGFYGSIGRVYADRCNEGHFTMQSSHTIDLTERYDERLLPLLNNTLQSTADKNFLVVHLMGAHEDYKRRYPSDYSFFKAEDESGESNEQRQIRAEYDNAILYNDHIVNEIISLFENKNAIVIYVSDHAEEIYDIRDICSHGDETSSYQREIPMIIWTSKKFQATYPELIKRIDGSLNRPYMTDHMIHTLMDIVQIETPEYDKTKSIINDNFDITHSRMLRGGLEYHKEDHHSKLAI